MATLTVSATNSEVPLPVNTVFQQRFLRNARPLAPYFLGSMPGEISGQEGAKQVTWRRFNTSMDATTGIGPSTSTLSELTGAASYMQGRSPDTVDQTDVSATVAKYGQFYIISEEVLTFNPGGSFERIVDTMAITGGRAANQLMRNQIDDNGTAIYSGGTSDGDVDEKISLDNVRNALNALARNAAMPFTPIAEGSTITGSTPLPISFWGFCHPDVSVDIASLAGYKAVETYASHVSTFPGEIGAVTTAGRTVRFVESADATVDSDTGATSTSQDLRSNSSSIDLYATAIIAQEAFGSVGMGRMFPDGIYRAGDRVDMFELIMKGPGAGRPSGTDDPFDEITTVAFKFWWAGAQLNSNWSRVIRSGATSLT